MISNKLRIMSPKDGAVVEPGQPLHVVVEVPKKNPFIAVQVIGENMITEPKTAPPFTFDVTIPSEIGKKQLRALGIIAPERGVFSRPVTIDAEPQEGPTALSTNIPFLIMPSAGGQFPLYVSGSYASGLTLDLTRSAKTSYQSRNPAVATVDAEGLVIAVGPGETTVLVGHGDRTASVNVVVKGSVRGDLDGDGDVDVDDFNKLMSAFESGQDWTTISAATRVPVPSFDARDLTHDGFVDAKDVKSMVQLIGGTADLGITVDSAPNAVAIGGMLTYTITVVNHGPHDAPGTYVSQAVLSQDRVQWVSSSPEQCGLDWSNTIECHFGTLASGSQITARVVVKPSKAGILESETRLLRSTLPDPVRSNDTAKTSTIVLAE